MSNIKTRTSKQKYMYALISSLIKFELNNKKIIRY